MSASTTGGGGVGAEPPREGVTDSPNATATAPNMDPNNAAYLALRNHPETTIRPIASENEESDRHNENMFKQASNFFLDIRDIINNIQSFPLIFFMIYFNPPLPNKNKNR